MSRFTRTLTAILSTLALAVGLTVSVGTPASAANDVFPIHNAMSPNRCLDAKAEEIGRNGTPIQLWDCYGDGQTNQMWTIRFVPDSGGWYQIVNRASGRCLDAMAQHNGENGTPVQLWDCLGRNQTNQLWLFTWDSGRRAYILLNKVSRRVLDAQWQQMGHNGTPVQLWDLVWPNYNQRWYW